MGKSHVFRDVDGRVVGYLQQIGKQIRVGISRGNMGVYELYMHDAKKYIVCKEIGEVIKEYECNVGEENITGGCLVLNNSIVAFTSEASCAIVKSVLNKRKQQRVEKTEKQVSEKPDKVIKVSYALKHTWPPNPCDLHLKKED